MSCLLLHKQLAGFCRHFVAPQIGSKNLTRPKTINSKLTAASTKEPILSEGIFLQNSTSQPLSNSTPPWTSHHILSASCSSQVALPSDFSSRNGWCHVFRDLALLERPPVKALPALVRWIFNIQDGRLEVKPLTNLVPKPNQSIWYTAPWTLEN